MNNIYLKLKRCLKAIREKTDFIPEAGLILGSGLGDYASGKEVIFELPYSEIEGFPVSTVAGHEGRFIFAEISGKKVVMMQGRVHYYEGYDMSDVVLPVRLMCAMGAKKIILTNAAGGMGEGFEPGDLMLITDQISSLVPSPLRGKNCDEMGLRFPDMSEIYTKALREAAIKAADKSGITLKQGVYIQTPGPNYESPAEIRMYKLWGADAVGMSTACEAIAAKHMGAEICGISCISNLAAGISKKPLTHEEVKETGEKTAQKFKALIDNLLLFC